MKDIIKMERKIMTVETLNMKDLEITIIRKPIKNYVFESAS